MDSVAKSNNRRAIAAKLQEENALRIQEFESSKQIADTEYLASVDVETEEYANGSVYRGQLVNGEKHGLGIFYLPNRTVLYFGEWKHDKYDGRGTYLYEDGERYEGQLRDG